MKRMLTWLVVLLVLVGIISAASYPIKTWWEERQAPKYLTATVSRGRVETMFNSTGTIKLVRTVSAGAFTSGPINQVFFDFNDWITRPDEILALIDDKLQNAALKRDEAAVGTQKAELDRVEALLD